LMKAFTMFITNHPTLLLGKKSRWEWRKWIFRDTGAYCR